MPVKTRSNRYQTPPPDKFNVGERTSRKRVRFYDAWDKRSPTRSLRALEREFGLTHPNGQRWLDQRTALGSPAYHRTRKLSDNLGPHPKVSADTCKMLVSPSRNKVRDQQLEAQIEYHKLPVKKRALQNRLKANTNKGQRYKMAYIKKRLSLKNRGERIHYGAEHQHKTVHDFWQYVYFTDEAHLDPSSQAQGYILREQGTRLDPENIQERGEKTGVTLHVFAYINWWEKSELYFYKDEEMYIEKPKKPPKPRTRKYETKEEFEERIRVWEASIGHDKEVKPKGNAITQKYYHDKLLPVYVNAIHKARFQPGGEFKNWILQEDGDPSHGKKKKGLAQRYLQSNWIPVLHHPPQSPDLNPIEGVWNILKNRVRKRSWRTEEEFRSIILQEWDAITMDEIRARIAEMPERCKGLIKSGGAAIKSELW